MISVAFVLGLVALLATPGPTNTLLALGGATRGAIRPALPLLLAEVLAYLAAIIVTGVVMGSLFGSADGWSAGWRMALQLAAAGYLVLAAVKLWRQGPLSTGCGLVTPGMVALATLTNPKAVIIALALMPAGWADDLAIALPSLALIALLVPAIGFGWVLAGLFLSRGGGVTARRLLPRLSSLALGGFALLLARAALAAA
jgi:threonine/homoserine/homoserine lactone efflux protein